MRYINSAVSGLNTAGGRILPSVCIARQAGARGQATAHELARHLNSRHHEGEHVQPWTVFEANLVNVILADYMLPKSAAQHMPEDKVKFVDAIVSHFMSDSPSDRELFEKTVRTIRRLLMLGRAIVVGRGANYMSQDMPQVLKVLLTVSDDIGRDRVAEDEGIPLAAAEKLRKERNSSRLSYIRQYLGKKHLDPGDFDLVIHTDNLQVSEVVELISERVHVLEKKLVQHRPAS